MMRAIFIGFLAATAIVSAPASPSQTSPASSPQTLSARADAAVPAPTAKLRFGKDDLRSGELRIPDGHGPFPVMILVHGGCWTKELGRTGMQSFAESLRRRGVATWDIDYRRVGHEGGGWPGTY